MSRPKLLRASKNCLPIQSGARLPTKRFCKRRATPNQTLSKALIFFAIAPAMRFLLQSFYKCHVGIAIEVVCFAGTVGVGQRAGQIKNVGNRKVPFGTSRRDDV